MSEARIVLMDVDGCVNLIESGSPIRSGIALLVDTLVLTGHEVVLWSAGGAEHAEREASRAGFNGSVRRYLTKPDYPMTLEAALAVVGSRPLLQIDDDSTERVADWPFAIWHNASDEATVLRAELSTLKARVEGLVELLTIQERHSVEQRDAEMTHIKQRIAEIEAAGVKPPFNMNFGWHSFMAGHVTAMGHCLAMAKDSEAVTRTLTSLRALEGSDDD